VGLRERRSSRKPFPDRLRGAAATFLQSAAAIGPILAALANIALSHMDWRWLFVVGVVPALLTIWVRYGVREPERWVQARSASTRRPWFADISDLVTQSKWRRNLVVALVLGVVGIAGAGNLSYWLPNIVSEAGKGWSPEILLSTRAWRRCDARWHAGWRRGVSRALQRMGSKASLSGVSGLPVR